MCNYEGALKTRLYDGDKFERKKKYLYLLPEKNKVKNNNAKRRLYDDTLLVVGRPESSGSIVNKNCRKVAIAS